MVVTNAINHRSDGRKYPLNPPEGWVFMAFAIDLFAPQALDDGGTYMDFAWADADIPPQNPRVDALNAEHKTKAKRRRPSIARALNGVLLSGEVKSAYSTIGGGGLTPIPSEMWRTDDPLLRYRTFSFDPADPFSERPDLPCWIWLEAASLANAADRLKRERRGWGPLPEPPPLPRVERNLRDDGTVEVWSYDADGVLTVATEQTSQHHGAAGRPAAYPHTLKLFADRLRTGKVAERVAWEGVALSKEYGTEKPPKPATCEGHVREFFNMIRRDSSGSIVNAAEILEAMDYPINPDKSLYSPMKAG